MDDWQDSVLCEHCTSCYYCMELVEAAFLFWDEFIILSSVKVTFLLNCIYVFFFDMVMQ